MRQLDAHRHQLQSSLLKSQRSMRLLQQRGPMLRGVLALLENKTISTEALSDSAGEEGLVDTTDPRDREIMAQLNPYASEEEAAIRFNNSDGCVTAEHDPWTFYVQMDTDQGLQDSRDDQLGEGVIVMLTTVDECVEHLYLHLTNHCPCYLPGPADTLDSQADAHHGMPTLKTVMGKAVDGSVAWKDYVMATFRKYPMQVLFDDDGADYDQRIITTWDALAQPASAPVSVAASDVEDDGGDDDAMEEEGAGGGSQHLQALLDDDDGTRFSRLPASVRRAKSPLTAFSKRARGDGGGAARSRSRSSRRGRNERSRSREGARSGSGNARSRDHSPRGAAAGGASPTKSGGSERRVDGGGGDSSPGRSSQARSPSSPERQGRHRSRWDDRESRGGGRSRDHSPLRAEPEEGERSPSTIVDPSQLTGGSGAQ